MLETVWPDRFKVCVDQELIDSPEIAAMLDMAGRMDEVVEAAIQRSSARLN